MPPADPATLPDRAGPDHGSAPAPTGPGGRRLRALVYGDVDLNVIDGSAIWAQSAVEVLAAAGCDVTLVCKAPVTTTRLLEPLEALEHVEVVRPHEQPSSLAAADLDAAAQLTPEQFVAVAADLDQRRRFDLIVVRGFGLVRAIVADGRFDGRLWTYLTDVPQHTTDLDDEARGALEAAAAASRVVLCQTEELRTYLETEVPAACGKSVLYPPVVPAVDAPTDRPPPGPDRLELVYIGKYARRWNTLEMTRLPAALRRGRRVSTTLHMVGDKIHRGDEVMPDFRARMRAALEDSDGVVWHGGQSRAGAMRLAGAGHVGLSWRDPELDASLELSTKVLEYGTLGLPVVLNRTPAHEDLLGADYPLFATSYDDVIDVLAELAADPDRYRLAAQRCRQAAAGFGVERAVDRIRAALARTFPSAPYLTVTGDGADRPLRVGVASHDLKFFTRILDHYRDLPQVEVRVDPWESLRKHDVATSTALRDWADVVVCEWCGTNAAWYSANKREGQRLIVRLHRFELYSGYPAQVEIDGVDQVVCVSPHYARLTRQRTGWPAERIGVIANWVDDTMLDRPKLPGSQHHLGMIGISPARKRFDLGLDVLERLRAEDPRFMLFVKSKLSWDYWWIWNKPEEQRDFDQVLARIQSTPELRDGVVFDGFGPDVAPWLRKIGFVLSTSDDESFHLSPAEGMAAGAVPVIRDWPGVETIYDPRWIQPTPDDQAARILDLVGSGRWEHERRLARDQATEVFGLARVFADWRDVLVDDLRPAADSDRLTAPTAPIAPAVPTPA